MFSLYISAFNAMNSKIIFFKVVTLFKTVTVNWQKPLAKSENMHIGKKILISVKWAFKMKTESDSGSFNLIEYSENHSNWLFQGDWLFSLL